MKTRISKLLASRTLHDAGMRNSPPISISSPRETSTSRLFASE